MEIGDKNEIETDLKGMLSQRNSPNMPVIADEGMKIGMRVGPRERRLRKFKMLCFLEMFAVVKVF